MPTSKKWPNHGCTCCNDAGDQSPIEATASTSQKLAQPFFIKQVVEPLRGRNKGKAFARNLEAV